ncbi:hypothetical protein [Bacteroides sp. 519]|uniref:hypothetical protein n=1 Tax=Bacteroides sp. 519 TaxID=2302937 RepID=UPI0013D23A85|nr:hypothetical protein [Bacteroides sp. 519]NDV57945.1 hypothetical protein [Bacteroides sp. 519]
MKEQDSPDLTYSIPPEQQAEKCQQIQQCSTFLWFIEHTHIDQLKLLNAEIDKIFAEGISLEEFMLTGMNNQEVSSDDYRTIAILCFYETFMEYVEEICAPTRDLKKDRNFTETYDSTMKEIINYLDGKRNDFPREMVRCLFLLTDEDLNPHRQGMALTQLVLESFAHCHSNEQRTEIERLIKECKI